jgi:hypothetical protein
LRASARVVGSTKHAAPGQHEYPPITRTVVGSAKQRITLITRISALYKGGGPLRASARVVGSAKHAAPGQHEYPPFIRAGDRCASAQGWWVSQSNAAPGQHEYPPFIRAGDRCAPAQWWWVPPLPTTHYPLPTTHYPLPTNHLTT